MTADGMIQGKWFIKKKKKKEESKEGFGIEMKRVMEGVTCE